MSRLTLKITCILSIISIFFLSACSEKSLPSQNIENIEPSLAKLVTVGEKADDALLNYPATVKAENVSTLSFEVSGVVDQLLVVESQRVQKGDVLAKLDDRDLLTKLQSAQAQFDNANGEFERAERLIKEDAISKSEFEQRRAQRDVNKAQLDTAKKAMSDATLIAPFDGYIADISIKNKQAIQAGTTAITILGQGEMEATINLPASIMARADKTRNDVGFAYLVFSFAPEQRIPAKFKEASLSADSASQTYKITFTFTHPKTINILPGMNATLWFLDPRQSNNALTQLTIPLTSVGIDGDQKYVWLVDQTTMLVNKQNITVQDGVGEKVIVTNGLKIGDTVVAAGISSVSAGMKVRPWSK